MRGAFLVLGTAMAMTIAEIMPTNPKNIAKKKEEPALVIFLPVIMEIAYLESTSVMETMIVLMDQMKMKNCINAVSSYIFINVLILEYSLNH